jgi:hypothetical protein
MSEAIKNVDVKLSALDMPEIDNAESGKRFSKVLLDKVINHSKYTTRTPDNEPTQKLFESLAEVIEATKANNGKYTSEQVESISNIIAEIEGGSSAARKAPQEKVTFNGKEMTAAELAEERQAALNEIKTLLSEIGRKHVGDAYRKEEHGGVPGYTALYGSLTKIKNLITEMEAGASPSNDEVAAIFDEYNENLTTVMEAIENEKKSGAKPNVKGKTSLRSPEAIQKAKDALLEKIEAATNAEFSPKPELAASVYALTKERRKSAVERASRLYENNQATIATLPTDEQADATQKAEMLFQEAVRLADPDNTEVLDTLEAHQAAVEQHIAAEKQYQEAFKKAAAAGKKEVDGSDIDIKTQVQQSLKRRIEAEEAAFKMMAALRGIEFRQEAINAGVKSHTYVNEVRKRRREEHTEIISQHNFPKKLYGKIGNVLGSSIGYIGKKSQALDTKINRIENSKLRNTAKFTKRWGMRIGAVAITGTAGAMTAGTLYGVLAAAPVVARIAGGMTGAAVMGAYSNLRIKKARSGKKKGWTELRGNDANDRLAKAAENVIAAEEKILKRQKNRGTLMFLGGVIGGGVASIASAETLGSLGESGGVELSDQAKSPDDVRYNHQDNKVEMLNQEAGSPENVEPHSSDEQVPDSESVTEVTEGESEQVAIQPGEVVTTEDLALLEELQQQVEKLEQALLAEQRLNSLQEQQLNTLTAASTTVEVEALPTEIIPTPQEQLVTVTDAAHSDTLSEAMFAAFKAGKLEGLDGMSKNDFLNKLWPAVHALDNNPEIMQPMHVASGDLDLVHADNVYNVQPLIDHMNGMSIADIEAKWAEARQVTSESGEVPASPPVAPQPAADTPVTKLQVESMTDAKTEGQFRENLTHVYDAEIAKEVVGEPAVTHESAVSDTEVKPAGFAGDVPPVTDGFKQNLSAVYDPKGASPEVLAEGTGTVTTEDSMFDNQSPVTDSDNSPSLPVETADQKQTSAELTMDAPSSNETVLPSGHKAIEPYVSSSTAGTFTSMSPVLQERLLAELETRAEEYGIEEIDDKNSAHVRLFETIVQREALFDRLTNYFASVSEDVQVPAFLEQMAERTTKVMQTVDAMPGEMQAFFRMLNQQGVLQVGRTVQESIESAIADGRLFLESDEVVTKRPGIIRDHVERFRVGPQ